MFGRMLSVFCYLAGNKRGDGMFAVMSLYNKTSCSKMLVF